MAPLDLEDPDPLLGLCLGQVSLDSYQVSSLGRAEILILDLHGLNGLFSELDRELEGDAIALSETAFVNENPDDADVLDEPLDMSQERVVR